MARPEHRTSFGARFEHAFDGLPALASYLVFTGLARRAPALARGADRLSVRFRRRTWLVGRAETDSGSVDVAYLGSPDRLSRWLLDRLGVTSVREHRAALAPGSVRCDVELCLFPAAEARDWARNGWLTLPRYAHHRQKLGPEPSSFERRVARRIRKQGVTLRLSRDPESLDRFQRELYDPMLRRRHGDRALRTGRALLRFGQRRGGLFIAEIGDRAIAAAVGAPSATVPGDFEIWALGVAADALPGSGLAPVLGWVEWAREHRFSVVDHVASLPLYSDGLTRQKLRWGTEMTEPIAPQELLALRVHGTGAPLLGWLRRHGFAARSKRGLVRIDVTDPGTLPDTARSLLVG